LNSFLSIIQSVSKASAMNGVLFSDSKCTLLLSLLQIVFPVRKYEVPTIDSHTRQLVCENKNSVPFATKYMVVYSK
jgi:hypothetical protein